MQQSSSALLNRPDTMLGVCEGIGQDFGFNPIFLRIALAVMLPFQPLLAIGAYLVLGVAVAVSRWLAPTRGTPSTSDRTGLVAAPSLALRESDADVLPIAA